MVASGYDYLAKPRDQATLSRLMERYYQAARDSRRDFAEQFVVIMLDEVLNGYGKAVSYQEAMNACIRLTHRTDHPVMFREAWREISCYCDSG